MDVVNFSLSHFYHECSFSWPVSVLGNVKSGGKDSISAAGICNALILSVNHLSGGCIKP